MCQPLFIEFTEVINMRRNRNQMQLITLSAALLLLIFDSKAVISSAYDAIVLCIRTLIPSLFPFFVITSLLTRQLMITDCSGLRPLEKLLRLPKGCGATFLLSLLSGYPVGAAMINDQVLQCRIAQSDAKRMITFCNNAGPAFIFGIGTQLFPRTSYCWLVWITQILSALVLALLTPVSEKPLEILHQKNTVKLWDIKQNILSMATVCGWVVIFRIAIGFLQRWVLWLVPEDIQIFICGSLELANGAVFLSNIENPGQVFLYFNMLLAFGGVCVLLQTRSVATEVDQSWYFPAKLTQAAVVMLLSVLIQFVFPTEQRFAVHPLLLCCCIATCIAYRIFAENDKKAVEIPVSIVYNQLQERRDHHGKVVQKEDGAPLPILRQSHRAG